MNSLRQKFSELGKKAVAPENRPITISAVILFFWFSLWLDWTGFKQLPLNYFIHDIGFLAGVGVAIYWFRRLSHRGLITRRALLTAATLPVWALITYAALERFHSQSLAAFLTTSGLVITFVVGLCWVVWYVEIKSREYSRSSSSLIGGAAAATPEPTWNPLDLAAWYYHRRREKLDQSFGTFLIYLLAFGLVVVLLTGFHGCEVYDMPAGGGKKTRTQTVQVQTKINKKYVINPYSSVLFNPPPIDEVKLKLLEVTKHRYAVGQGEGDKGGFSEGTELGKVHFIRLQYDGGDWDQDGLTPDLNMLTEYSARNPTHSAHDVPETKTISQLGNTPRLRAPPFVYMTGQKGIDISGADIKILREYLLEKHGMLFADNGGSGGWDGQFKKLMSQVLPNIRPIRVPLDHPVHLYPNQIPFLPYVAPHGGKDAIGWVYQGRLVCYYHPGDIGDAWADGHAGVKRQIWMFCYDLGENIMYYAHAEKNKWLTAEKKKKKDD